MAQRNPSAITTDLQVDEPLIQNARFEMNADDRQYLDNQIRGTQQHLVDALIRGKHATYVRVAGSSATIPAGYAACLASLDDGEPQLTLALAVPLGDALAAFGVLVNAGVPGSMALVAFGGVLPPMLTGLAKNAAGFVRVNAATGALERVVSLGAGDYGIGIVDKAGYLLVIPGIGAANTVVAGDERNALTITTSPVGALDMTGYGHLDSNGFGITVSGVVAPGAGKAKRFTIHNNGDGVFLVLKNEDVSVPAADRFFIAAGADLSIDAGDTYVATYSQDHQRWVVAKVGGSSATVSAGDGVRVTNVGSAYTVHGVKGTCSLEQFGAVGDGVADDSTPFANALAALAAGTYHTLVLGARTYLVTGGTLPAGCSILGQGPGVSTLKTTTNGALITIGGEDVSIGMLTLKGNSTGAAQHLIKDGTTGSSGSGHARVIIHDVELLNAGGNGLDYQENPLAGGALTYLGPQLTAVRADGCVIGFNFGNRGEYARLVNCHAQRCTSWGIVNGAGNVGLSNCTALANANGYRVANGTNGSHSEAVGCAFSHNTSIQVQFGATLGYKFVGCSIYGNAAGSVTVDAGATGATFLGCQFDIGSFVLGANSVTRIISPLFGSSTNVLTVDDTARLEIVDPRNDSNSIPTSIQSFLTQTFTFPADANQTATSKLSSAHEILLATGSLATNGRVFRINAPPDQGRERRVRNKTSVSVTVAWASGVGVPLAAGLACILGADGTDARIVLTESSGSTGEANTISSVGGTSLVAGKVGVDLEVKGLTPSAPLGITSTATYLGLNIGGLAAYGSVGQAMRVAAGGASFEWYTPSTNSSVGASGHANLSNGTGGWSDWTGVTGGSGFIDFSAGATVAGVIRAATATSRLIVAGTQTYAATASGTGYLFCDSAFGTTFLDGRIYPGSNLYLGINSTSYMLLSSGVIRMLQPTQFASVISGDSGLSKPLAFKDTLIDLTGVTSHTATPAEYSCPRIYITRGTGATCEVVMPNGGPGVAFLVTVDAAIVGMEVTINHLAGSAGATLATGWTRWVVFDTLQGKYVFANP